MFSILNPDQTIGEHVFRLDPNIYGIAARIADAHKVKVHYRRSDQIRVVIARTGDIHRIGVILGISVWDSLVVFFSVFWACVCCISLLVSC
ncbi:hypothetical protein Hanom_Chr11g01054851 [Helianthus anomalus]